MMVYRSSDVGAAAYCLYCPSENQHISAMHKAVASTLPDWPGFMPDYEYRFAAFYQKMRKFHESYLEALL
jgi:hypothetical protein